MSKIIRLIDRTRTVADWKCPRSRYWGYEYLGRGITKSGTSLALFVGIVTHDALAAIATFTKDGQDVPIDEIADAAYKQIYENILAASGDIILPESEIFAKEQATLTEGMIRGFYRHVWPRIMKDYTIIHVEGEMEYKLGDTACPKCKGGRYSEPTDKVGVYGPCVECEGSGTSTDFIFMTKPDLIVEDKEGNLIYIEYKTTSSKKENWVNSWETAVQLHSSIKATEQTLGRPVTAVQIVGLYKGYESYGKQSSPFCYTYKKAGNPPFTKDQFSYEYKSGFKRSAVWELPGGLKKYLDAMPEDVLANQFPLTAPIYVDEQLVESFFKQRLIREKQIATAVHEGEYDDPVTGIDAVFPQHFDQCVPSFGFPCPFKRLCHGHVTDPLTEGFELRTPHHERELRSFEDGRESN